MNSFSQWYINIDNFYTITKWNSVYKQLQSVVYSDQQKHTDVLQDTSHDSLLMTKRTG